MEMDLQLSLIAIGVACATAVAVYLVSVIGIKEKSFEEAIAEQKKRSDDLLGSSFKKDKKKSASKDKTSSKKIKKKDKNTNNNVVESAVAADEPTAAAPEPEEAKKRNHVEIVEEPEIMTEPENEPNIVPSRRASVCTRRDSLKPILTNKDEVTVITKQDPVSNNFEQTHPKDDCELKKTETESHAAPGSPRIPALPETSTPPPEESESKKKERPKQKKTPEDTALSIEKNIEKLPLTSSEIQHLIDALLNKQHAGDSEWINKTKTDNSVAGLKKQLESLNKSLSDEQSSNTTLQNKLKELRTEYTDYKNKFACLKRTLEDSTSQKNLEVQNLTMRLRQVADMSLSEKTELQKQLTRMNIKFKDVQDEYESMKSEYRNYRDAEQAIRAKAESLERETGALKTQCGHLENQLKNAFQSNQEMTNKLRNLQEHVLVVEERKKSDEMTLTTNYRILQEREAVLLNELTSVKNALSQLESENTSLLNRFTVAESKAKSFDDLSLKFEESSITEVQLRTIMNDLTAQVENLTTLVQEKTSQNNALQSQIQQFTDNMMLNGQEQNNNKQLIDKLNNQIESLQLDMSNKQSKNDELRHKNQKLVESLSVTEESLQAKIEKISNLQAAETKMKADVKKLAPSIDPESADWVTQLMSSITDKNRDDEKNSKLQDEVVHYQAMLKETETLLSTLQSSINDEEKNWAAQMENKKAEVESLKGQHDSKVQDLELQIEEIKAAKRTLENKCAQLENSIDKSKSLQLTINQLQQSNESLIKELESAKGERVNGSNDECVTNNGSSAVSSSSVEIDNQTPPSPVSKDKKKKKVSRKD